MKYKLHALWGIFYRTQNYLLNRFPRRYPGGQEGHYLSGEEQLSKIKTAVDGQLLLKGFQIVPYDDTCRECQKVANRHYNEAELPTLPLPNCPYGDRCRAIYAPIIDYGLLRVTEILTAQPKLKVQEIRKLLRDESDNGLTENEEDK